MFSSWIYTSTIFYFDLFKQMFKVFCKQLMFIRQRFGAVYINEYALLLWQIFALIRLFLASNVHVFFYVKRVSEKGIKEYQTNLVDKVNYPCSCVLFLRRNRFKGNRFMPLTDIDKIELLQQRRARKRIHVSKKSLLRWITMAYLGKITVHIMNAFQKVFCAKFTFCWCFVF